MYKLKKIPFITTTIALIIVSLISAFEQVSLNVLSMRVIIVGIIFYFLGWMLKYFLSSVISDIESKKVDIISIDEDNNNGDSNIEIEEVQNPDKDNNEQIEDSLKKD